jgi:hypothetical protein
MARDQERNHRCRKEGENRERAAPGAIKKPGGHRHEFGGRKQQDTDDHINDCEDEGADEPLCLDPFVEGRDPVILKQEIRDDRSSGDQNDEYGPDHVADSQTQSHPAFPSVKSHSR